MTDSRTEYQWLEMATSDDTVDSPFWPSLGELTHLLSKETALAEEARLQGQEIETRRVPIADSTWVRIESTHPTEDVMNILVQLNSQASEGIACALIITLANDLRSLSGLFGRQKSQHGVCEAGPNIGRVKWADAVVAASNYVRHGDEWSEAAARKAEPTSHQKKSVETLRQSGLETWTAKASLLEVARHLQLDRWETLIQNLSDWLTECMPSHPGARLA